VHSPSDSELHLLQALADSTAVAMESVRLLTEFEERVRERTRELEAANEEIRQLSLIDELTGLNNRRGFFVLSEQARNAAIRLKAQVFLLFIDADGLKKVNDTLGHEAGDAMLRSLGQVLKATFRRSDIVARLGGDEFCVFGMHDDGDASAAKQRLNEKLAAFNASQHGPYRLAASAGIFAFAADDPCSLEEVVARADKEMYAEKQARRSRG
jgi:diguanylate cyclase (GGDEF)-like protein